MKQLIFVIGVGRSGTSLLQNMLHAHSLIFFIPESHFIKKYMQNDSRKKKIENLGPNEFFRLVYEDVDIRKSKISVEKWLSPFISSQKEFKLEQVFRDLFDMFKKSFNSIFLGEKDAKNIDYLAVISKYFPNSKIIHIYRDPRDVVLSKSKANWSKHRPYWLNAFIGCAQLYHGNKRLRKFFNNQHITVKYEDLIQFPQKELSKICSFLKLNYEPEMLHFHKYAGELFLKKEEQQYKRNNFQSLRKYNFNKWESELDKSVVGMVELLYSDFMDKSGYNLSSKIRIKEKFRYLHISLGKNLFVCIYPFLTRILNK